MPSSRHPDRVVFHDRNADGEWKAYTWTQFANDVDNAAFALETLGIKSADKIAIFSANCPEILVTDFAAYRNRAVRYRSTLPAALNKLNTL